MAKMTSRAKNRRTWIPIVLVLVLAAGAGGYYYWNQTRQAAQQQVATSTIKTAVARRGSIVLSASGTGTLTAAQTAQLAFPTTGTVAALKVQVGDTVTQGEVLAQLGGLDTLQAAVNAAQQNLVSAQQALDTLKQSGPANLGNAQLAVATAQKAVDDAQAGYIVPGMARCDQKTTDALYSKYLLVKKGLDALGNGGNNQNYYLTVLVPAQMDVNKAYQAYLNCAGFTSYETDASHAKLALAQAQLKTAQDTLALLQQKNGINPTDLASAENKVSDAQVTLDTAKLTLENATLKAPFAGTVTAVAGQVGDSVTASSAFITISDLAHPQIQFVMDETDLDKIVKGEKARISFDAIPNQTFNGTVVRINPSLVTTSGYQTVQGLVQLDLNQGQDPPQLLSGMTASVTLIKAEAQNVLVVPAQAVRDLGNGQYSVFVVGPQDKLTLKFVQVGLMDTASAEITSGLNAGDVVSTGEAQTRAQ